MMKTIASITLGVVLMGMLLGGIQESHAQDSPIFFETYPAKEVFSAFSQNDPLFRYLDQSETSPSGSRLGTCSQVQKADLMSYLQKPHAEALLPEGSMLAWSRPDAEGKCFLYALRKSPKKQGPGMKDITSIQVKQAGERESYDLFLSFSEKGSLQWAAMTRENVGSDIAIVVAGEVISAPRVQDEIQFGKCRISGKLSQTEANEIKALLGH